MAKIRAIYPNIKVDIVGGKQTFFASAQICSSLCKSLLISSLGNSYIISMASCSFLFFCERKIMWYFAIVLLRAKISIDRFFADLTHLEAI